MNISDEGIIISSKKFSDSVNLMKVLTKNNGIYSRLWAVQTGEVEND